MEHSTLLSRIEVVNTPEGAEALCRRLNDEEETGGLVAYDTEWYEWDDNKTNVHNCLVFCATFSYFQPSGRQAVIYLHNYGECDGLLFYLSSFFANPRIRKTAHNAPVDWHAVSNIGIPAVSQAASVDTMVADHLLDERRENMHGLKECAFDFLGHERAEYKETFSKRKTKKDGSLTKNVQWEKPPPLPVYVEHTACPTVEEALERAKAGDDVADKWLTLIEYAAADAYDGLLLYRYYRTQLSKFPWMNGKTLWHYFWEVDVKITSIIMRMERHGMLLDLDMLAMQDEKAEADQQALEVTIVQWAGAPIKLSSAKQKAKLLYGHGTQSYDDQEDVENPTPRKKKRKVVRHFEGKGYPVLRLTPGGDPSTKGEHIRELAKHLQRTKTPNIEGLVAMVQWTGIDKQRTTYLKGLPAMAIGNRVHGRINQVGTTSSRFSSSTPNLQNITTGDKDMYLIRDAFIAPTGYVIVDVDWSQLEYRLLAHFSQEPKLIAMFRNEWDLHSLTTYNIFPVVKRAHDEKFGPTLTTESLQWIAKEFPDERKKGKTLNFEIIYGVGHKKLADQLDIPQEEGKRMIDAWFGGYPYVKAWMSDVLVEARKNGFFRLIDGRPRRADLRRLNSRDYGERGEEERTLVNAKVQGSAAAMMRKAMIRIDEHPDFRPLRAPMIMQVHDELLFECPKDNSKKLLDLVVPIMEQPFSKPLRVPMPVGTGVGPCWNLAK